MKPTLNLGSLHGLPRRQRDGIHCTPTSSQTIQRVGRASVGAGDLAAAGDVVLAPQPMAFSQLLRMLLVGQKPGELVQQSMSRHRNGSQIPDGGFACFNIDHTMSAAQPRQAMQASHFGYTLIDACRLHEVTGFQREHGDSAG